MCDAQEVVHMLVPKYLEGWTRVKKNTNDAVVVEAVCTCGHTEFRVFKNVIIKTAKQIDEERELNMFFERCRWRSYHIGTLKDGKTYAYRKNLLGVIVDKVELSNEHLDNANVVKIRCTRCGKEYVAFDDRIHGCDAFVNEGRSFSDERMDFEQKKFGRSADNIVEIEICIINQFSFEEFCEEFEEICSIEDYSNAFGNIDIYARVKDLNDKKVAIFSEETA